MKTTLGATTFAIAIRRALRVLLVSCAALAAGGTGTALATTVEYSGDTLVVTGNDNADHDIQFRLSADTAHDEIIDSAGFTTIPGDCTIITNPTWISCPGHTNVKLVLGAGSDDVTFGVTDITKADCFNSYDINLGDGANTLSLSTYCPPTPAVPVNVTSGSGPDILTAGSQGPVTFAAGGGDDDLNGGAGDDVLHGGDGADRIFGLDGNDQLLGEGGADSPNGGAGNDLVDGGADDDALEFCSKCAGGGRNDTGAGADTYVGGSGTDTLWLDNHPGGIAISPNGVADDGNAGEGDNVSADIEDIQASAGDDVYTGGPGADKFEGNGGNDTIHGGDGADDLSGNTGDDKVYGDAGNDKLQGQQGADTIDGGAGADALYGNIAGCSVFCSADIDSLLARDGERDTVDCGGGGTAQVDALDVVGFCPSVDRQAAAGPLTPKGGAAAFTFKKGTRLSVARGVGATVTCPAACTFTVSVVLSKKTARKYGLGRKSLTVGTARGTLLSAGSKKVTVKLSRKAKRKLRRAKRVAATLKVKVKDAAGKTATKTKAITLRR